MSRSRTGALRGRAAPALLAALLLSLPAGSAAADGNADDSAALRQALGVAPGGFARATAPRALHFPDDHGSHPGYRSEWWYYTGNLATADGRRFAFQLTFFRFALTPSAPLRASAWASNQVYMAHFTVSDVARQRFHAAERFSRAALGLAGARAAPFGVWVQSWQAGAGGEAFYPQKLGAADGGYAIDLRLDEDKPVVLNGDAGLSRKSDAPGNASYYYSIPRSAVSGSITTPEGVWPVRGTAWFDREWSTSALGPDQIGWDWFALRLSDGRDLMIYRLRRADGSADPHSAGTLVQADGAARALAGGDFVIDELAHWQSPRDGARYPARWRLRVPSAAIDVEVTPEIADQELNLTFRYWEGACRVTGTSAGAPVGGHAHVELTGYAESAAAMVR